MALLGFDDGVPRAVRVRVIAVLAAAVLGISSSAVLVRGMAGADPVVIAAWRTLGAAVVLAPALGRGLPRLEARDRVAVLAAGVALGLHFWTWFASLTATTVLRSTLLVCTVPAWTAGLEWALFGVRPRLGHAVGLAVALPGLGLLAASGGRGTLAGDALAIGAAVLWAAYFLLGRELRQRVDAATTMSLVCAAAAAVLFPMALVTGAPLGGDWPAGTWGRLALAVLGPQLVGHLGFVYAVRYVRASTVSMVALLEPVGATVLAAAVLGEIPSPGAAVGGALVLVGIAAATRD